MTDLHRLSASELSTQLASGALSSVKLTGHLLERIHRYNPKLKAILELCPDALEQAAKLDEERSSGRIRGPLHGLPILIKDNIDVDKMPTTAGSLALEHSVPFGDAFLVARLRAAGLVILGKTNLSEFAHFTSLNSRNGLSAKGGQTLNPYGEKLDVGGSSSGSGAGVAAGFAPLSIGTETSGSILSPSSQNAVVGVKTTLGLVSRTGILPIAHSQDVAGPMTRTVRDAALLMQVLAAPDPADEVTLQQPSSLDFLEHLHSDALKGVRLGVPRITFWNKLSPNQVQLMDWTLERLKSLGATLVDPADFEAAEHLESMSFDVLVYEFKYDLERYLSTLPDGGPRTLRGVLDLYAQNPFWTGDDGLTLLLAAQGTRGDLSELAYHYTRARDLERAKGGLDALLAAHKLDALVFPAHWAATVGAKAGYPSVCLPLGFADGAPFGFTFTGPAFSEPQLLGYAYALEQNLNLILEPDLSGF